MHVLVMASQKGGSGKTTLSGHLAVEAERAGVGPVALIDTDPQGSLSQWWNARAAAAPHFAKVGLLELGDALAHLKKSGVRLAVIDTPPAITASISQVVAHADLVVVPTRPSPHDLRAVGATVDIAEHHGKPLVFVMNGATLRARITGEAAVALSQHGTVAPVTLHHRVDFAASMVDGRTVGEVVPKSHSAREVRELWLYIQDRLARLTHDQKFVPAVKPEHLSIAPLTPHSAELPAEAPPPAREETDDGAWLDTLEQDNVRPEEPSPMASNDVYPGPERRMVPDRREGGHGFFGAGERRTHPFGRRASDRTLG
jgi:chromosome partitioning protein